MEGADAADRYGISSDRWAHSQKALVFYLVHHYVVDPEELAQETMLRIVRKLSQGQNIDGENGFEKLCFAFARHVLQESRRARVGEELDETMQADSEKTIGLNEYDFNVLTDELLARLEEDERELAKHVIQDTLEQFAEQSGVPVQTMRVRASRLKKKLRRLRDGET